MEAARRAHQFLQVLHPRFAALAFFRLVVLHQPAAVDHMIHLFEKSSPRTALSKSSIELGESSQCAQ